MRRFRPKFDVTVPSDAQGVKLERMYLVRFKVSAEKAVAASNVGVLAATPLTDIAQEITSGLTSPAAPRNIKIKGNASGNAGNVVIHGRNYNNEVISETIALSGSGAIEGNKAFRSVSKVDLPVQTHAATNQIETATVAGTITLAGNVKVTITAAGMTGSPKEILVDVANTDTAGVVAGKIRDALALDEAVTALFDVSGTTTAVILTKILPAANDATLNIATDNGTSTGLTPVATSTNTASGVIADTVSVGWGNKLGIPYQLPHNTIREAFFDNVVEGTPPTVTTSTTALESNTVTLNSALAGKVVDVYLWV